MTSKWIRLRDRLAGKTEPEPLWTEGIPDHINVPIRDWLYDVLRGFGMATPVAVRLRLPSKILQSRDPAAEISILDDRMDPSLTSLGETPWCNQLAWVDERAGEPHV
ncbi:hypothetical protein [Streptomyces sp. NPDC049944]|uniref:hypothetical protein n=1 Tax=Streptomyces sp. NPDC049944 TaxID=3155657 RepID=UPI0034235B36